ncbi:hypothetical protein GCM10025875_02190 [Litorihabitans aurantiacus]|uniref:Lipase n=1 Tax=Litorihabitans aurantiacus TaxID=1930061 RepID=A0AA37XDN1_9MICO|nr:hypothetical protein GCM10025875_02190 [Litorihabitans aurantiacus]
MLSAVVGLVLVAAGAVALTRPLATLLVLAVVAGPAVVLGAVRALASPSTGSDLTPSWRGGRARWWAAGVLAAVLAVGALLDVPRAVGLLPWLVALTLLGAAARLVLRAVRGTGRAPRPVTLLAAVACAVAAWPVLTWPDLALLLLATTSALSAVVVGVRQLVRAVRPRRGRRTAPRWLVATGFVTASTLVLLATAGLGWLRSDVAPVPDFYAWDGAIPAEPGTVLRTEAYDGEVPPASSATRVLYTTTRQDGSAAVASAVVVVPDGESAAPRTVLAWQHGTTGVAQRCAPSLTAEAVTERNVPGVGEMVRRGWVVVATDYPGQGTAGRYPYLIGQGEGRATLDAVRAARALPAAQAGERVMLWGHSQGGHATLWAGRIAADYAPELEVASVAALSAASDPLALAHAVLDDGASPLGRAITSYVLVPYAQEYPDIRLVDTVHPAGRVFASEAASRCASERGMLVTVLAAVALGDRDALYDLDLEGGPVAERLRENAADGLVPAPLFLGQGADDEVVPIDIQRTLAGQLCAAGRDVEVHEYEGRTHMGVIAGDSPLLPDLFAWVDALDAGEREGVPRGCQS